MAEVNVRSTGRYAREMHAGSVALLRSIDVGGENKVEMAQLETCRVDRLR